MELFADIGVFVLFLAEYAAYLFCAGKYARYVQADPSRILSPWLTQLMIVVAIVHIGLALLLLTRVFSLLLLGLLLAAYEFAVLVALASRVVLGSYAAKSWLLGVELGVRHGRMLLIAQLVTFLAVVLVYPIGIGIAYFSLEKGSDPLLFWVLALTAATVLIGVVWQFVFALAALLSPYVDDSIRTQSLVGQLMAMSQLALWIAIAYWASGSSEGGIGGGDKRSFGLILIVLLAVIVASTILPYVAGSYRARRERADYLDREQRWWKRLVETTAIPMRPDYESDVRSLQQDLDRERVRFGVEHESFFRVLKAVREPEAWEELAPGVERPTAFDDAFEELATSEAADTRVRFDANLVRIERATTQLLEEVAAHPRARTRKLAEGWMNEARQQHEEAEKEAEKTRSVSLHGRTALSFLISPIIALYSDQLGAWISDELSRLTS